MKTAAILLFLFIFGITTLVYADSVKSIKNTVNQETTIKMDENKVPRQKKAGVAKGSMKLFTKHKVKSQSSIPYSDDGELIVSTQFNANFLTTLKEKEKSPLAKSFDNKSFDKMIYFDGFSQNAWGEKFLNFKGVAEAKSTNPGVSQSHSGSYPPGNKYFEERRILETFKLLQLKREEISKEIFMGFHFSFNPLRGHMFLEMNAIPSFEKGPGFVIPF
jgi:hypothetical protein